MKILYIVLVVILILAINFGRKYTQKYISSKLTDYLYSGDFVNFEKLINKRYIKYLIHPFNVDFLKLNEAIFKQDKKEIEKRFNMFDNTSLTDKQKTTIYQKAFFYYLQNEDVKKLEKYYLLIKESEDKTLFNNIDDIYKIVVLKSTDKLNQYKKAFEENNQNPMLAFLLYHMYRNSDNKKLANDYLDKFNELVKKGVF